MKKKSKFSFTPSLSKLKYGSENYPLVRGLRNINKKYRNISHSKNVKLKKRIRYSERDRKSKREVRYVKFQTFVH